MLQKPIASDEGPTCARLQSKDAEIYCLLEERQRLDLALHTIKDMTAIVRQASPASVAPLGSSARRGQQLQQQAAGAQGPQQGQQQRQELSASGSGRDSALSMESPTLLSPILAGLSGLTVLGVPVSGYRGAASPAAAAGESPAAEAALSSGDEAALSSGDEGPLSGAVSIAAEVPSSSEEQQPAPMHAQQRSGVAGTRAERQGSSGDAEQRQLEPQRGGVSGRSSSQHGGEAGSSSTAAGPALSSAHSHLSGPLPALSPQPPLIQPWEVQGAVDLGAALAAADLAAGPLRQSMPVFANANTSSMGPPPPRQPLAQRGVGIAPPVSANPGMPSELPGSPEARPRGRSEEPAAGVAGQNGAADAEAGNGAVGGRAGGRSFSPGPPHPVFNPDMRSRISTLYDLLNPFDPG
jgi:hypothetical protein